MKDAWYSDKRDLVKWGTLLRLAEIRQSPAILQVAYYRPNSWPSIDIDGTNYELPEAVTAHFRRISNARTLCVTPQIIVLDSLWTDRPLYLEQTKRQIRNLPSNSIVFLDPDTGLEPNGPHGFEHVLEDELQAVWDALRQHDLLVFYQHQTNRNGRPWEDEKKRQFEVALNLEPSDVKVAKGRGIARDVVFFFTERS
jgi:hypothetical protein